MNESYTKYLSAKLYLIEAIALRGKLAGDKKMEEIHNICLSSYEQLQEMLNTKSSINE